MPKLSEEERSQVWDAFHDYDVMLKTSNEFLTRAIMRVNNAKEQEDLVRAIDLDSLNSLCDLTVNLLIKFRKLTFMVDAKVKDQKIIKMWRDVSLGLAITIGAVLLIGSGVGAAVGFPAVAEGIKMLAGAGCILGISSAALANEILKKSPFEEVLKNLNEIKRLLTELTKNYSTIAGMRGELNISYKEQLLRVLEDAKAETDKGYELSAKF